MLDTNKTDAIQKKITFPVNEHGWVLLFQLFGHKTIVHTIDYKDKGRVSDEDNQHRCHELICEGGVKVRSKMYDTSEFVNK
jgi:hypothetical protein